MTAPAVDPTATTGTTDVEALVRAFESCSLSRSEWDHRAHLTVALWYVAAHGHDGGLARIRAGILRLNAALGVAQTPTSGYHETLTRFFTWVVWRFVSAAPPGATPAALVDELIRRCGNRDLPLAYYSRERLMSWEARTGWVPPDLRPLDG